MSRLDQARLDLVSLLDRFTAGCEGTVETPVPGLFLHRIMNPGGPKHGIHTPALALIAQGSKRLMVGDEVYHYDPMHYLVGVVSGSAGVRTGVGGERVGAVSRRAARPRRR